MVENVSYNICMRLLQGRLFYTMNTINVFYNLPLPPECLWTLSQAKLHAGLQHAVLQLHHRVPMINFTQIIDKWTIILTRI